MQCYTVKVSMHLKSKTKEPSAFRGWALGTGCFLAPVPTCPGCHIQAAPTQSERETRPFIGYVHRTHSQEWGAFLVSRDSLMHSNAVLTLAFLGLPRAFLKRGNSVIFRCILFFGGEWGGVSDCFSIGIGDRDSFSYSLDMGWPLAICYRMFNGG